MKKISYYTDMLNRKLIPGIYARCIGCADIYPVVCEKHELKYCGHCYDFCPRCNSEQEIRSGCEHNDPKNFFYKGESGIQQETKECLYAIRRFNKVHFEDGTTANHSRKQ